MNRRADPSALMPLRDNAGHLLNPADWRAALPPAEGQAADAHARRLGGAE